MPLGGGPFGPEAIRCSEPLFIHDHMMTDVVIPGSSLGKNAESGVCTIGYCKMSLTKGIIPEPPVKVFVPFSVVSPSNGRQPESSESSLPFPASPMSKVYTTLSLFPAIWTEQ